MDKEVRKELEKLKFQIKQIAEAIELDYYTIPSLVIEMDWGKQELDKVHNIFKKYNTKLEAGETPDWNQFEQDFNHELGIGYRELKIVILAYFGNDQWVQVCRKYAKAKEYDEFHEITGSGETSLPK
ncbi:MAG: hypothetical protein ACM3SY_19100 [Candidatus Omnitrophota bacterium]